MFLHRVNFVYLVDCFFSFFFFFFSVVVLNVFEQCGGRIPFLNLFSVTLKNLRMLNVNLFCRLYSFVARCFYPIVEFFLC